MWNKYIRLCFKYFKFFINYLRILYHSFQSYSYSCTCVYVLEISYQNQNQKWNTKSKPVKTKSKIETKAKTVSLWKLCYITQYTIFPKQLYLQISLNESLIWFEALSSNTSSILDIYWDFSWIYCWWPVSWRSCSFRSVGQTPSSGTSAHRWKDAVLGQLRVLDLHWDRNWVGQPPSSLMPMPPWLVLLFYPGELQGSLS